MVSLELVEELRMIIKEDYKVELSLQDAYEVANTLVNFFDLLAKIESEEVISDGATDSICQRAEETNE